MDATTTLMSFSNFDLINTVIACVAIFATVYVNNKRMKRDISTDHERKLGKKADKSYVENTCKSLHEEIQTKADKSLVESMDSKLDLILQKLK